LPSATELKTALRANYFPCGLDPGPAIGETHGVYELVQLWCVCCTAGCQSSLPSRHAYEAVNIDTERERNHGPCDDCKCRGILACSGRESEFCKATRRGLRGLSRAFPVLRRLMKRWEYVTADLMHGAF
jgi:hypothetical protein